MKIIGVIPSRFASTRFPGKPLVNIKGKSMIQRVYAQAKKCQKLDEVIVATDNKKILNHVINFGGKAIMTSKLHKSGTERCNETIQKLEANYDLIINIQGDEPYINPKQIEEVITLFKNKQTQIGTLVKKITDKKIINDKNIVKAIVGKNKVAFNFYRQSSDEFSEKKPYYKHIGIYAFRKKILNQICQLPLSKNEQEQQLEQLRWIENGYKINVGITVHEAISVDIPEDIEKINQLMK